MKSLLLNFLVISLFHLSCNRKKTEYKEADSGLYYKLIAFGQNGPSPKSTDYVNAYLTILTATGDTVFNQLNPVNFQLREEGGVDALIQRFCAQDSLSIRWTAKAKKKINGLQVFSDTNLNGSFQAEIRILDFFTSTRFKADSVQHLLRLSSNEDAQIFQYLKENKLDTAGWKDGLYFSLLKINEVGRKPQDGEFIRLSYTVRFMDGRIFDSTKRWKDQLIIEYGKPMQLIEGLQRAISWMKEGEVAKIILPSRLSFASKGSGAGKVPPNTPLVFELKLLEILQ